MGWPQGRSTQAHEQRRQSVGNLKAGGHVRAGLLSAASLSAASLSAGLQRHRIEDREPAPCARQRNTDA